MRFPFAKTIDYQVECQFRKDPAGRLFFFPFGVKKQGYFVDSKTDEEKIKAYLRKYRGTAVLISLLVSPSIYIPALLLDLYGGAGSVRHSVTIVIELSVGVMLFFLTLSWARWVSYKQAMRSFTTTLSEIGPESRLGLSEVSDRPRVRRLVLAGLACLILGAAALIGATRYSRSKVVCPPTAASRGQ
ncbi:membrane hypothetical protein [Candidatus Sulfotelmatobacter sp. SbA7]|nr:membrane hypothetical protein [Candidatus Sulfotelmatobacter sp. SbA7]